jgi:predicted nucleic acid-binding protein
VNVYLDASVLVALFTNDPFTGKADEFLRREGPALTSSDFAMAEFASAIARRVRTNELTIEEAQTAFSALDVWSARAVRLILVSRADIAAASVFLRRLDLPLRTPDAINIAVAERAGCTLFTFDRKMAKNAAAIGVPVVSG